MREQTRQARSWRMSLGTVSTEPCTSSVGVDILPTLYIISTKGELKSYYNTTRACGSGSAWISIHCGSRWENIQIKTEKCLEIGNNCKCIQIF